MHLTDEGTLVREGCQVPQTTAAVHIHVHKVEVGEVLVRCPMSHVGVLEHFEIFGKILGFENIVFTSYFIYCISFIKKIFFKSKYCIYEPGKKTFKKCW